MTDPIGDMIIRIKNAAASKKASLSLPLSKKTLAVAQALERAGYLEVVPKKGKKVSKLVEVKLAYVNNLPRFKEVRRVSSISKRIYQKIKNVAPVKSRFGNLIMSTPLGVLTDEEARKKNVGGEPLFQIW